MSALGAWFGRTCHCCRRFPSRQAILVVLHVLTAVSFLYMVIVILCYTREAHLLIQADTEVFEVTVASGEPLGWDIEGFRLFDANWLEAEARGRGPRRGDPLPVGTRFALCAGARVKVTRSGEVGALNVEVSGESAAGVANSCGSGVVAFLSSGDLRRHPLRGNLVLRRAFAGGVTSEAEPVVLPLRGRVTVGDDVATGVRYLMLGGHITVVETVKSFLPSRLISSQRYVSEERDLLRGDRVVPHIDPHPRNASDEGTYTVGFVRIVAGKPMALSIATESNGTDILTLSGAPIEFRSTLWTRFRNEPHLVLALALSAALAACAKFLRDIPWPCREPRPKG